MGFVPNYQPILLCCMHLIDDLSQSIDDGNITAGVFVDLAKAFHTVNHTIVLNKLQHYGIRGVALKWFESYLLSRKQFVVVNKACSGIAQVQCGVPSSSSFAAYSCDGSVARRATSLIFSVHTDLSAEMAMASSSDESTESKSACTVLSHEDFGRPLGRLHSTGTLAIKRPRTSERSGIRMICPRRERRLLWMMADRGRAPVRR